MELFEIVRFDKNGLVPVIAQDFYNKDILMFAYANKEAIQKTIETGFAHYYSRSRNKLWKKGEESGNVQKIKQILFDCDEDCLLYKVEQVGCACHTFHRSCFFREYVRGKIVEIEPTLGENFKEIIYNVQNSTLSDLYETILQRKKDMPQNSYTAKLFSSGIEKISKKISEETLEFLFALKDNDTSHIIYEASDVVYHFLVGLAYRQIPLDAILEELKRRKSISGEFEKQTR